MQIAVILQHNYNELATYVYSYIFNHYNVTVGNVRVPPAKYFIIIIIIITIVLLLGYVTITVQTNICIKHW